MAMPHETSSISPFVTASIGVETAIADVDSNPRNFVEEVDRMLYAAKHNGRNRIEVATL
jgi:PleD family two-component response regulator